MISRLPTTAAAVCLAALALTADAGVADAGDGFIDEMLARAREALAMAASARRPKPPVPVPVQWRPRNRGPADLGGRLLALDAADLDGDGAEELVALTTRELIIISTKKLGAIRARAALPGKFAVIRSRDPVGTISIEGQAVLVRTSEQAVGGRYVLAGEDLVLEAEVPDFPLCAGITARLQPGRNGFEPKALSAAESVWPASFEKPKKPFYALECRQHIGEDGRAIRSIAVTGEERVVSVHCDKGGEPCPTSAVAEAEVEAAGVAFEIADVDNDGRVEVIASRGQGPGRPDRVRVFASDGKKSRLIFSKSFSGGVVALTALDLDGDGSLEVIAAVRVVDSLRVNLWTLNRTRTP